MAKGGYFKDDALFEPFFTPSFLPTAFRQYIVTLLESCLTPTPLPTAFALKVCPPNEIKYCSNTVLKSEKSCKLQL